MKNPDILSSIQPLYSHETPDWCIVYYSNKTQSYNQAKVLKEKAIESGIEDAFVTAYYKGQRIQTREALELIYKEDQANSYGAND